MDPWWQDQSSQQTADPSVPWWQRNGFFGDLSSPSSGGGGFFGNIVHGVEDVGKAAGTFFGGIVKSVASDAVGAAKTVGDIGQAVYTDINAPKNIKANQQMYQQATKDYNAGKISLDQLNQKYQQFQQTSNTISSQVKDEGVNKLSGAKAGAQTASTFLNLATLGIGSGAKALVTGAGEDAAKTAAENTAKSAAAKFGSQAGANALLGAGYGGIGTLENPNATPGEAWHNALLGGLTGGALGARGALLDKNVRSGLAEIPGQAQQAASDALAGRTPMTEAGSVAPFGKGNASADRPGNAVPSTESGNPNVQSPQLSRPGPEPNPQDALFQEVAAHYSSPEQYVKETAQHAYQYDKVQTGGQLQKTADGGYARTTSHTPFYSQYYAEHGKPPTQAAFADQVQHALETGTSGGGIVDPQESSVYQLLQDRTGSQNALVNEPMAPHEVIRQQYMDAMNGVGEQPKPGEAPVAEAPAPTGGEAPTTTPEPGNQAPVSTPGGGSAAEPTIQHIDPATGKATEMTQEDMIDHVSQLRSIPKDQRTVAQATELSDSVNALKNFDQLSAPAPDAVAPTPPGERPRGFFDTMKNSDNSTPETKQTVGDIQPQTYEPKANQAMSDRAKATVEADPQAALADIMTKGHLSDEDVTVGHHLLSKIQDGTVPGDLGALADKLDTAGRESGRSVQAYSIYNRLTPEGTLRVAARKMRQARDTVSSGRRFERGAGNEGKVAQDIKAATDQANVPDANTVKQAVRDTANSPNLKIPAGLPAKPGEGQLDINGKPFAPEDTATSTGEKLAGRVEKAVTPQIKQKADALVDELTKKVKQEMLPQKVATRKSPTDVLKEVFARNPEAQDAFPEAQRILHEKFADNPKVQAKLDTFFKSELGPPAASSTFSAAIKEQLAKNETRISDVIQKSYASQHQSVAEVADALTKEGFDQQSAQTVAQEVTDRLNARIADAKKNVLTGMAKDVPKKARASYLDRVNKLSNLGAMTDHDYLALARSKLDLPQLTPELAQDIFGLSQKMQDLPAGFEKDQLAKQIYAKVHEANPKTKAQLAAEVVSAPKSIMASSDLSGTLRQGAVLGSRFPTEAKAAFAKQVHYFKSAENYDKDMSAMKQDPDYEWIKSTNTALTGVDGSEEAYVSQLPEKIPVFGRLVGASDRAYTGGLTQLRFMAAKHIMNDLRGAGIDPEAFSEAQRLSIGKFINTSSGRGYGDPNGFFEKVAPALNRTLFSPRLWKSRLDMLNPVYYAKLDPVARKYALQSASSFAGIASVVFGLAAMAGLQVETDPRSSDFLKIKSGDTRYDILGGFQQNLVFAWRELSGQKKSSTSGDITDLSAGKFGGASRLSILSDLIQNKENPVISTGSSLLKGTDKAGQPVNATTTLGSMLVPLNVQDIAKIQGDTGNPFTALIKAAVPGTLGVGVNTYSATPPSSTATFDQFNGSLTGQITGP